MDKLEQTEITMKLEESENLKLQYVNNNRITTSQINNIQDSDNELAEQITQMLNIYDKNPNFKDKPSFKKCGNFCCRYGHSIAECRQKQGNLKNTTKTQRTKQIVLPINEKRSKFTK